MKKLLLAFGIVFSATCAAMTAEELNANIDAFIAGYATNRICIEFPFGYLSTNRTLAASIDDRLCATPPENFLYNSMFANFPKTVAASRTLAATTLGFPLYESVTGTSRRVNYDSSITNLMCNLYSVEVSGSENSAYNLKVIVKRIMEIAPGALRRKLRSEGKSILTDKDGNDPCKPYLDQLSLALEAPRFAGLSNALENCGISIRVPEKFRNDEIKYPESKVTQITNSIYFGDIKFTPTLQTALKFNLGTKEYNRFVERYNGK